MFNCYVHQWSHIERPCPICNSMTVTVSTDTVASHFKKLAQSKCCDCTELQEKLKVATEAFESIIIHRISGSDVYQSSESMQLEAREALAKIRGEG